VVRPAAGGTQAIGALPTLVLGFLIARLNVAQQLVELAHTQAGYRLEDVGVLRQRQVSEHNTILQALLIIGNVNY
jgi:hypothetical protein